MRKRTKGFLLRLTDAEKQKLNTELMKSCLGQEEFCRRAILGREIPPPRHPDLSRIRRELNAIGNNINQLARAANSGDRIPRDDMRIIEDAFSNLEAQLMEVLKGGRHEE